MFEQRRIFGPYERPATKSYHPRRRTQFRQELAQCVLFGTAELGLAGFTKDLLDAALFPRLDSFVQILKGPVQLPSQSAAGAGRALHGLAGKALRAREGAAIGVVEYAACGCGV